MKFFNQSNQKLNRRHLRQTSSGSEKGLWSYLRKRQLHGFRFVRQFGVDPYILDFYCPSLFLAIEVDGPHHRCPEREIKDKQRDCFMKHHGIHTHRISTEDILDRFEKVLDELERVVLYRAEEMVRVGLTNLASSSSS